MQHAVNQIVTPPHVASRFYTANGNTTGVKDVATLIMGGAWLYGYALPFCLYTLTGENM